jgi:hypothetical protein
MVKSMGTLSNPLQGALDMDGNDIRNAKEVDAQQIKLQGNNLDSDDDGILENADVDALTNFSNNDVFGAYPLQNADLANSDVKVAGNTVSLGGSTNVDLADLANAPHSDLDDAPASAHHTRFTDDGTDALSDIPNAPHSDLDDAPADAHHNAVDDEDGTFAGASSSSGSKTVSFGQAYATGSGEAGFDADLSPVNDADAYIKSYTTNGSGDIDGMIIRWHNTTGSNETVRWRFSGRPA